jgi:hypothetical protein
VILLDHNVPAQQVARLQRARLRPQQIGRDIGRPEWQDLDEILRYLHRRKATTVITRDEGFFHRRLCHANYCLVVVSGVVTDTAVHVLRFLRHPAFRTKRQRLGKVIRLSAAGIAWWDLNTRSRQRQPW